MVDLPQLTIGVCTYKRPQYACLTIQQLIQAVGYDGKKRFHISDGGSSQEDIEAYKYLTRDFPTTVEVTDNLADMVNSIAHHAEELWMVVLDDFTPRYSFNITPDVKMLLAHPEIGQVRFGRLAFWGSGSGDPETSADLVGYEGLHWWRIDKERTRDGYSANIGFHLYHRRFWDAYGDIPSCDPKVPGQAELNGCARYNGKPGPTIAVPMRFGEDCQDWKEPIWHLGTWHTDEYMTATGSRF